MLTKELLQRHPSSACDKVQEQEHITSFSSLGMTKKTLSSESLPRQQYPYLTNLFAICSKLTLKHSVCSRKAGYQVAAQILLVDKKVLQTDQGDFLLKNTCCLGLLPISCQNTLLP